MAMIPNMAAVATMKKGRKEDSGPGIDTAESSPIFPMWIAAERPSVSKNELSAVASVVIDCSAVTGVISSANRVRAAADFRIAGDESAPTSIPLRRRVRLLHRFDGTTKASITTAYASIRMSAVLICI